MTLEHDLRRAAARLGNSDTPHLDARVLARHALNLDDAGLIQHGNRALNGAERARLDSLIARRARGESVAHILGEKEFYGLNFKLAPGLLSPRPESETLIDAARARRDSSAPLRILDLGTGTGCLLCALLHAFQRASGVGIDINETAIHTARANAAALELGAQACFFVASWTTALNGEFDLVIANPPYIPEGEAGRLAVEIRDHEDPRALFGGASGLEAYGQILSGIPRFAAPGALIILELGEGQNAAAASLARRSFPAAAITVDADLAGRPRALVIETGLEKKV